MLTVKYAFKSNIPRAMWAENQLSGNEMLVMVNLEHHLEGLK